MRPASLSLRARLRTRLRALLASSAGRTGLLLLATGAVLAGCARPEPAPEPTRAVRSMVVSPQAAALEQSFAGEVRARTESRLGFRVGGLLVSRPAGVGDRVRAGQILAQLDARDLQLGQDAARAGLAAAQANAELATADLQRFRELRQQGFISGAELDRREAAARAAQAQFDQARAQLSVQGNQAAYASLASPAAGVITATDAEPGAVLATGATVLRLAHEGPRDVVFSVPENRVADVRALAGVSGAFSVTPWAGTRSFPATVREVAASADPVTRTVQVKLDIGAEASKGLTLGQTATVKLQAPPTPGVVKLPLSALREEQGRTHVWLIDEPAMTVRSQPVQLATADGNEAVIASGLKPGERVVIAGVHVLAAGQKVKLHVEPGVTTGTPR